VDRDNLKKITFCETVLLRKGLKFDELVSYNINLVFYILLFDWFRDVTVVQQQSISAETRPQHSIVPWQIYVNRACCTLLIQMSRYAKYMSES